jgi:hypothetical protein
MDHISKKHIKRKTVDLMGLGKRFAYKMDKTDETTPGPGMYKNIEPKSIATVQSVSASRLRPNKSTKFVFGVSRE